MTEAAPFDPAAILQALHDADVEFVVIGGIAGQAHGSPMITRDLDICYQQSRANLERLALVLQNLAAIRRGQPDVTIPLDARALLAGDVFTLTTRFGDLDLLGNPDPGMTFETLESNAVVVEQGGRRILVAGLDDLAVMKRAAGRTKDLLALEHLGALREELDRQP